MNQDHLDPEIVAAWVDGSLDAASRAEAETHAADCARCQAVLAAMIRTEPALSPKAAWLSGSLRWLVPLATATAIAGIWVLVSPGGAPPVTREAAAPAAEAQQTASARSSPVDAVAPVTIEPQTSAPAPTPGMARDRLSAKKEPTGNSPKAAAAQPPPARQGQVQTQSAAEAPPVQGSPAPIPIARATSPPPPPAAAGPPRADAPTTQRDEKRIRAVAGGVQMAAEAAAPASREVASPDLSTRWRYGPSAAIQRSTDGGRTWVLQPSGVTTELVAASAPSNTVCWIVGRAGVVLLSTDGATWRRLPFPETTDLQAVAAADARTASVTTADGRVFRTTDGGLTWTR